MKPEPEADLFSTAHPWISRGSVLNLVVDSQNGKFVAP